MEFIYYGFIKFYIFFVGILVLVSLYFDIFDGIF